MIKRVALVAAFVLSVVTASTAETPEQRQACTDDAFRVCQQAIPDQDRVFNCLVQNKDSISPLCRSALAAYLPAAQAAPKRAGKSKAKSTGTGKGPLNLSPNSR